jgi:hypothetical protein
MRQFLQKTESTRTRGRNLPAKDAIRPSFPYVPVSKAARYGRSETLQRKCGCGGSSEHECTCGNRDEAVLQRAAGSKSASPAASAVVDDVLNSRGGLMDQEIRAYIGPRFGHAFSRVRLRTASEAPASAHAVDAGDALAYTMADPMVLGTGQHNPRNAASQSGLAHELTQRTVGSPTLGTRRSGPFSTRITADITDGSDLEGVMINGIAATFQPACFDGGGVSQCNPDTGNYDIISNGNTCCSKDCTQAHEQRHVSDLGDCCQALAAAIKAGGDKGTLIGRYNTWMASGATAWTECNAHTLSVTCLENLSAAKHCDAMSSECCNDIGADLAAHRTTKTAWCAKAPAKRPNCPF